MESLKIFTPFGLIFLPAVTAVQEFTKVLTFQSKSPLLLKKFEFNAFLGNGSGTINKPIECLNVALLGSGISFQSPVELLAGLQTPTLDFVSTIQHVTERFEPGILFNPAEDGTEITMNILIRNSAPLVIGDALVWTAKFYFYEFQKVGDKNEFTESESLIDLSAYYPNQ